MKKFSITGVVWNFRSDVASGGFSRAVYDRTIWTSVPVTLDDFETGVGTVTAAWLDDTECVWITAIVEVADEFEFRGLGLHWMGTQASEEAVDPDTAVVVNIALCDPRYPDCLIYKVNPL